MNCKEIINRIVSNTPYKIVLGRNYSSEIFLLYYYQSEIPEIFHKFSSGNLDKFIKDLSKFEYNPRVIWSAKGFKKFMKDFIFERIVYEL